MIHDRLSQSGLADGAMLDGALDDGDTGALGDGSALGALNNPDADPPPPGPEAPGDRHAPAGGQGDHRPPARRDRAPPVLVDGAADEPVAIILRHFFVSSQRAARIIAALVPPQAGLRKHLPSSKGRPHAGSTAVARLAAAMAHVADPGDPAHVGACRLLQYLPALVLRKGTAIPQQLRTLANALQHDQPLPDATAPPSSDRDPRARWVERVAEAIADGDANALKRLLDSDPSAQEVPGHNEWVHRLHPPPEHPVDDEAVEWATRRDEVRRVRNLSHVPANAADVKRWASTHRRSAGDRFGWSASIIMSIQRTASGFAADIAKFWSVPIAQWADKGLASSIFRANVGRLLPQPPKPKPRPISAPSIARRIRAAALARICRRSVATWAQERGHVGMCGREDVYAYAAVPGIACRRGGVAHIADRSMSYQCIGRRPLLDAVIAFAQDDDVDQEAAAAMLAMAELCVFDTDGISRTTTVYPNGARATVNGLAQGCAASPALQTLTLAHAMPLGAPHPGARARGAHDDMWVVARRDAPCAATAVPDTTATVGGRYEATKAAYLSPEPRAAVLAGVAHPSAVKEGAEADRVTCFGGPVAASAGWAATVLHERFRRTVESIGHISSLSPDIALGVMQALRGPGTCLRYQLSHLPPVLDERSRTLQILRTIDDEWVACLARCLGHPPDTIPRDVVFSPTGWRHESAAEKWEYYYYSALSDAWPRICATVDGLWTEREIAEACAVNGVDEHTSPAAAINQEVTRHSPPEAAPPADTPPNLWTSAIAPTALTLISRVDEGAIRFAATMSLGLPIWPTLRIQPPSACPACGVPRDPTRGRSRAMGSGPNSPTQYLDDFGHHVLSCTRMCPRGGTLRRHNTWARALADISYAVGREGAPHDQPIFPSSSRRGHGGMRPADFLETSHTHPDGHACDTTVGIACLMSAQARADKKMEKFRAALAAHPSLRFTPIAADTRGNQCREAWALQREWSIALAAQRAVEGVSPGSPLPEVRAACGRAFAHAMFAHLVALRALCPP